MAAAYDPPFHSSRQDQPDYRHGAPHYSRVTIGDDDASTPGTRTATFRAYDGATLYTGQFAFNSAGTLTLTLSTPAAETVMTVSPTLQSVFIPATFSSPVTITDASTAALVLSSGGASIFGRIEADRQAGIRRFQVGSSDAFNRRLLWYAGTNDADPYSAGGSYTGDGPIMVLGCCQADGWPDNVISEGIVVWGMNYNGDPMTNTNFAYARVKPSRFQLRHYASAGVGAHDVFRADNSGITWRPPDTASNVLTVDSTGVTVAGDITGDIVNCQTVNAGGIDVANDALIHGKLQVESGLLYGRVISGGEWWWLASIAYDANDHVAVTTVTKDVDTKDVCVKEFYAGTVVGSYTATFKHAIKSGVIANQPRIVAFEGAWPPVADEILVGGVTVSGVGFVVGDVHWQSFTAISNRYVGEYGGYILSNALNASGWFRMRLRQGVGTGGTILHSQDFLPGIAGWRWQYAVPSPPIQLQLGQQYTIEVTCTSGTGTGTAKVRWAHHAGTDPYSGGYADTGPSDDFWFRVRTTAPVTADIFINGQPESLSQTYITIGAATVTPLWTSGGTGTWPTQYPSGTTILFDTNDTGAYPPGTNTEVGTLKCWDTTDCTAADTGAVRTLGGIYAAKSIRSDEDVRGKTMTLYDSPVSCRVHLASVVTSDATPTTLVRYTTATDYAYTIKATAVLSRASDGSTGSCVLTYKCKNVAGTVTNSGTILAGKILDSGLSGCDVTIGVSGTDTTVIATGLAGSVIRWGGKMKLLAIPL